MPRVFNGSTDRLAMVDGHVTNPGRPWSLCVWLKATSGANSNKDWYSEGLNSNPSPMIQCFVTAADKTSCALRGDAGGSSDVLTSTAIVADSTWHFIGLTQNSSNLVKLYVDRAVDTTFTRTGQSNGTTTLDRAAWGCFVTTGVNFIAAQLAHGASWVRELSAGEMLALALGQSPRAFAPFHYWPMQGHNVEPDYGFGIQIPARTERGGTIVPAPASAEIAGRAGIYVPTAPQVCIPIFRVIPLATSLIKTVEGVTWPSSVKSVIGLARPNVKTIEGLA